MKNPEEAAVKFGKSYQQRIDALKQERGQDFAATADSAFKARQVIELINMLLTCDSQEEFDLMCNPLLDGINMSISGILGNCAHRLTDQDIEDAKRFADEMSELQTDVARSMRAVMQ